MALIVKLRLCCNTYFIYNREPLPAIPLLLCNRRSTVAGLLAKSKNVFQIKCEINLQKV